MQLQCLLCCAFRFVCRAAKNAALDSAGPGKCLLIWTQAPEATRVSGLNTWKSLGRFVKKGQTGIRILAPLIRKVEEAENGTTERISRPFGFKTVAVFERLSRDLRPRFYAFDGTRDEPRGPCDGSHMIAQLYYLLQRLLIIAKCRRGARCCYLQPAGSLRE